MEWKGRKFLGVIPVNESSRERKLLDQFALGSESSALSRISPRVRVRVSVSIVYRIATGGYSWIWPKAPGFCWNFRIGQGTKRLDTRQSTASGNFVHRQLCIPTVAYYYNRVLEQKMWNRLIVLYYGWISIYNNHCLLRLIDQHTYKLLQLSLHCTLYHAFNQRCANCGVRMRSLGDADPQAPQHFSFCTRKAAGWHGWRGFSSLSFVGKIFYFW